MLRSIEANLVGVGLSYQDDWYSDPLFWLTIGGPAILLPIAALSFLWIDYKAKKLFQSEIKRTKSAHCDVSRLPYGKDTRHSRKH